LEGAGFRQAGPVWGWGDCMYTDMEAERVRHARWQIGGENDNFRGHGPASRDGADIGMTAARVIALGMGYLYPISLSHTQKLMVLNSFINEQNECSFTVGMR